MKMTIVIDTTDPEGVKDAYKVASRFYKKHHNSSYGKTAPFSTIAYIKMLRPLAREALKAQDAGDDPTGLRFTKHYADKIFNEIP